MKKGFTLIELLVSIGILGLVIAGAVSLFFSTMKSSKKTDNLLALRQSGDYALNIIRSRVYNADTVACLGNNLAVTRDSGPVTNFTFISDTLKMGGQDLVDSNRFKVSGESFECLPDPPDPNTLTHVKVGFTLEVKDGSGEEQSFQADIFLRDY